MAFPSLVSIETTYDFLATGQAEPLLQHLHLLIHETHNLFVALCSKHKPPNDVLRVNTQVPKSPIIPVFTCQPRSLATYCQKRGFMVRPIVAPTVPVGSERIRVCLHAGNTMAQVEGLVAAVEAWLLAVVRGGTAVGENTRPGNGSSRQDSAKTPGSDQSKPKL